MGARVEARLERYGFYPAGGGRFEIVVRPAKKLEPIELNERGKILNRRATALAAHLPRNIAERELGVVHRKLSWPQEWLKAESTTNSPGPGNVITLRNPKRKRNRGLHWLRRAWRRGGSGGGSGRGRSAALPGERRGSGRTSGRSAVAADCAGAGRIVHHRPAVAPHDDQHRDHSKIPRCRNRRRTDNKSKLDDQREVASRLCNREGRAVSICHLRFEIGHLSFGLRFLILALPFTTTVHN